MLQFKHKGTCLSIWLAQGEHATTRKEAPVAVRVDFNLSLDGFATTTDQTPEQPMGADWMRLVGAYIATRTMRERVFKDTSGEGTTGIDDRYARAYFDDIGAEIMGAGMFGLHSFPMTRTGRGGGATSHRSVSRSSS